MFPQGDRKEKKKAISGGVNVLVVLDMVFGEHMNLQFIIWTETLLFLSFN